MKFGRNFALLGMIFSMLMILLAMEAFVGDRVFPGWNGFIGENKNDSGEGVAESVANALLGKDKDTMEDELADNDVDSEVMPLDTGIDYKTYDTVLGDYRIRFDFVEGLQAFAPSKNMGVVSQNFMSNELDSITVCVIPEKCKGEDEIPKTAKEYIPYTEKDDGFGNVTKVTLARDFDRGDYYGIKYRLKDVYEFGATGYVMGYEVFYGEDYLYLFVLRNDRDPVGIKNLRIEKV